MTELYIKRYQNYNFFKVINDIDKDGDRYTSNIYKFNLNNNTYYVLITYFHFNTKQITLDFQIEKDFLQDFLDKKDIMCRTYNNTNNFNTFLVLSTVTKILIDYYHNNINHLNEFYFLTDCDKKHNIYKSIIRKYLPNWVITSDKKNNDSVWNTYYQF